MKKILFIFFITLFILTFIKFEYINAQDSSTPQPLIQQTQIQKQKNYQSNNCPTGKCGPMPYQRPNYNNPNNNNRPITTMQQPNIQNGPLNLLIILDSSYSMEEKIGNERKIDIAKRVIYNTLRTIPRSTRLGLRVYGHEIGIIGLYPCRKTELLVPINFNTQTEIANKLRSIQPTGQTPISYSVKMAVENDFIGLNGPKRIILVSDGMETCDGDPCDYAVEMVKRGIDMKIDVVGFAIKEQEAINQLKCIALSTEGKFYTADTEAALAKSLQNSMQFRTDVQGKIIFNK